MAEKLNIDVNDILAKARSFYGKDKAGAKQISSGSNLNRSKKESDFIIWEGNSFWQELTGLPGIPFGKFCQISGKPDSGKSSTCGQFMSYAQNQGCVVILWDSEGKFQAKRYDDHLKGDSKNLFIVDTNSIIDGAKATAYLVRSIKDSYPDKKILIVWDSVGASLNSSEDNEENEDMSKQPGASAKETGWAIKKFGRLINEFQNRTTGEHAIAILAVNQVYSQLMTPGLKEKGGETLAYFSSLIMQLQRVKDLTKVKSGKKIKHGIMSRARVKKNHLFDGTECLAEANIVVSADGVALADEVKKKDADVEGWDDPESEV